MEKTKYDNYFVTKEGTVYSNKSGIMKPLKPSISNRGYLRVNLSDKGKRVGVQVHRLVAETFLGNIEGMTINHRDGNKTNNEVTNLEVVTQKENNKHAISTGLTPLGENHSRAKISDKELKAMIKEVQGGLSTVKASKKYGLSQSYVSKVMRKIYRKDIWETIQ